MENRAEFAWQGLTLKVPEDWNLGRVDGDFEKGYARLDDAEIVRLELEWRRLRGRGEALRLTELVDRYLQNLEKKADKAGASFSVERRAKFLKNKKFLAGREYEVFIWEADFRAYNLALALEGGRVVLLRVLAFLDESLEAEAEAVFQSLVDQEGGESYLWSVYGLRFSVPADFKLESHSLKSGHIQLDFTRDKHALKVHRLSMARIMLKDARLKDWYPVFFKKQLRDMVVEVAAADVRGMAAASVAGRPRSRWRQLLRPLPFLNPRPRQYLCATAWHDAERDKIAIVEHFHRKKDAEDGIAKRVVDGHFFEGQRTEAEPGRHAGVATDAQ
ncbi:MAG: hypothetical protein QGH25_13640 [Candidatus Latescibacteria bacterium]|jgi:hypothetical protein|nr:hypothetical protein [Candidatus Latescibacterota bacterium]